MSAKESWSTVSKSLAPILGKTKSVSKFKKRRNVLFLTSIGVFAFLAWFMIMRWIYRGITNADHKEELAQQESELGCSSIRDCLEKDSIQAARFLFSKDFIKSDLDLIEIIKAESNRFIREKKFEEGWTALEKEKLDLYKSELLKQKFELLTAAVDNALSENKLDEAKKWALKASPDHNKDGYTKEQTNEFNEKETQRNLLIKRIKDFQKLGI
jgi:hypothetical protein